MTPPNQVREGDWVLVMGASSGLGPPGIAAPHNSQTIQWTLHPAPTGSQHVRINHRR